MSSTTPDVLDVEQQQRVKALGVARDILGASAGIFAGKPPLDHHEDVITDLIELTEYVLTGRELVHYTDEDTGVRFVDLIDLSVDAQVAQQVARRLEQERANARTIRIFGFVPFPGAVR